MASTRNGKTRIVLITRSKQIYNYNYSINEFTSSELDAAEGLLQLNPHSLPPLSSHKEEKYRCLLSRRPVLPSWGRRRRRTVGVVTHPSSSLQDKPPLLGSSKVATGDKISSPSSFCMSPNTPLLFPDDNGVNDANLMVEEAKAIPFMAGEAGERTPLPFSTNAADYLLKSSKLNYNKKLETKVIFKNLSRQHALLKHVEHAANTKFYQQLLQPRKEEKKHRKLVLKIKYSDASVMPKNLSFRMNLPPNPLTCCSRSNQQTEGTNHL